MTAPKQGFHIEGSGPEAAFAKAARAVIQHADRVLEVGGAETPLCTAMAAMPEVDGVLSIGLSETAAQRLTATPGMASQLQIDTAAVDTATTEAVAAKVRAFGPNVLILHAGPGEVVWLQQVDLSGFDRCVISFERPDSNLTDRAACKARLKAFGFRKQPALSSRRVWVCSKPARDRFDTNRRPSHQGGWSERIEIHQNAVVQPTVGRSLSAARGVQTASGEDVPLSAHWRHARRMTLPFPRPQVHDAVPGRHLWGGIFYSMFSHFVAESLSRLWALDADVASVVFIKIGEHQSNALAGYHRDLFDLMGVRCPVHIVETPTAFGELVVPGQGFGLGAIVEGTARFKSYLAHNFATDVAADGPEKLYISRSLLGTGKGSILGESVIEARLRDEGYEVFHPQQHDIRTQIARYRAARQVVACDGSALHLLALCQNHRQRVAVICRRKSAETRQIARNIKGFTGVEPCVIQCLDREWQRQTVSKRKGLVMGQPNLPLLHAQLLANGFVTGTAPWAPLTQDQLDGALGADWSPI